MLQILADTDRFFNKSCQNYQKSHDFVYFLSKYLPISEASLHITRKAKRNLDLLNMYKISKILFGAQLSPVLFHLSKLFFLIDFHYMSKLELFDTVVFVEIV